MNQRMSNETSPATREWHRRYSEAGERRNALHSASWSFGMAGAPCTGALIERAEALLAWIDAPGPLEDDRPGPTLSVIPGTQS